MHRWLLTMLLLLPLAFASGCATQQRWTKSGSNDWNTPAVNTNLRLFDAKSQGDVLVVYDEYSGWNGSVRTRAFFLKQNEARILHDRAPHFVSTNLAGSFPPIPVISTAAGPKSSVKNPVPGLFAVAATDEPAFTIYSGTRESNSYQLPVYEDRKKVYEANASTVAKDTGETLVCAGAICGCVAAVAVLCAWGHVEFVGPIIWQ